MSSRSPSHHEYRNKRSSKHRGRSRSPDHHHRKNKKKREKYEDDPHSRERSRSPVDDYQRPPRHQRPRAAVDTATRHKHMKQEQPDRGYDRAERGTHQRDQQERRKHDRRRAEHRQEQAEDWGRTEQASEPPVDKEKPNFGLSGKLTEDTNTYKGVVIKYNEPEEARKPRKRWRLYPFKGEESLPVLHIHRQSAFLFGRDRRIADIPVDHPSCSKQHAVFQYRMVNFQRPDGRKGVKVQPYIIDLGSANGTYVNNNRIDAQRYVELFEKDVIKFGYSSREYVLLHDNVDVSEIVDSD